MCLSDYLECIDDCTNTVWTNCCRWHKTLAVEHCQGVFIRATMCICAPARTPTPARVMSCAINGLTVFRRAHDTLKMMSLLSVGCRVTLS